MTEKANILTDEAFERTKPCREGHNCCHNNNFGGELCNDCRIDPYEDYVEKHGRRRFNSLSQKID